MSVEVLKAKFAETSLGAKVAETGLGAKFGIESKQWPEVHIMQERPWQVLAGEMRTTNINRLIAAERAVRIALLNRLIDRSEADLRPFSYDVVPTIDLNDRQGINRTMVTLPPEKQREAQHNRARTLYAEYQAYQAGQHGRSVDPEIPRYDSEAPTQPLFSPGLPDIVGTMASERERIFNQISAFTDAQFADAEQIITEDQKKLGKRLPGAQNMIDQALPTADEIEPHLTRQQRKAAMILTDVSIVHALIKDTKENVPRAKLHRRNYEAVRTDLQGLLNAFEQIQQREGPTEDTEAYYERVSRLLDGLEIKKNAIYQKAVGIPEDEVNKFLQTADRSAQLLMMRRLRKGEQRDLFADWHEYDSRKYDVHKVSRDYWKTVFRQLGIFGAENLAAVGVGVFAQWALPKLGFPPEAMDILSTGLEGVLIEEMFRSGYSEARSIRKGVSTNVPAQITSDKASELTDNQAVQDTLTATAYFGSTYGLDVPAWAGIFTLFHNVVGYGANQLFNLATGANGLGLVSQKLLREYRERKTQHHDEWRLFREVESPLVDSSALADSLLEREPGEVGTAVEDAASLSGGILGKQGQDTVGTT